MSRDTRETPEIVSPERRRTFHFKVSPKSAKKLAMYAHQRGMLIAGALEAAIELLTTSPEKQNRRGTL